MLHSRDAILRMEGPMRRIVDSLSGWAAGV